MPEIPKRCGLVLETLEGLITQLRDGGPPGVPIAYPHTLSLFGGHCKLGENPKDSLVREITIEKELVDLRTGRAYDVQTAQEWRVFRYQGVNTAPFDCHVFHMTDPGLTSDLLRVIEGAGVVAVTPDQVRTNTPPHPFGFHVEEIFNAYLDQFHSS